MSSMRTASASSRGSGMQPSSSAAATTSRRYRRVAHSPQVDDTLFASQTHNGKNLKKSDRSMQAGRNIVGGGERTSNQDHDAPQQQQQQQRKGHGAGAGNSINSSPGKQAPVRPTTLLGENDLHRIKHETRILTHVELEALEAKRDADQEQMRMSSKKRKEHMLKLSEEAALRAPKTQIEQLLEIEKQEVLRKATILKEQAHDSVKLIRTLGARAQAFTIRDQQKKMKEELDDHKHVYDEKMNLLMEVERLEGLKKQEEVDDSKKMKRYADRKVLEDQIDDRKKQRAKENELIAQEATEMLEKIQKQQEEETQKELKKSERTKIAMEEIKKFNEQTLTRKANEKQRIKDEETKVILYQQKKANDQRLLEEEEARKRHDAELRCAKLRSMQEKMANEKAEMDELRAKRAAESRERSAREAELAFLRKQKQETEELRAARDAQAMHRQRARVKEAAMQQKEYESIMAQVESDKKNVKQEEEKKKIASLEHRKVLQAQIEGKEKDQKQVFMTKQAEGYALKEEYKQELDKLERIRIQEVDELVKAGVNPMYLSEMMALDIEKIRNR